MLDTLVLVTGVGLTGVPGELWLLPEAGDILVLIIESFGVRELESV
tara:strand:+ start:2338 stop:2475 length:138 start_codon:yes stop_codon:yes gene_type:complete